MDVSLAKTFLTVLSTKSFVAAADNLLVTQSAVSLRIQKLELMLGGKLLKRSKSGVEPTQLGEKFEEYARSFVQLWDETRYQISLPSGFEGSLNLSCTDSLWPELSAEWVKRLEAALPTTTIHFQIWNQEIMTRRLVRGTIDIGVAYTPEIRPGLNVEKIMNDQLVLVSADKKATEFEPKSYVYCHWGTEFGIMHSRWFPSLKPPQLTLGVGTSLPRFLIENGKSAFLPYRVADDYVARGELHFVRDAPRFPYPAYAVWVENKQSDKLETALDLLRQSAKNAPWIKL